MVEMEIALKLLGSAALVFLSQQLSPQMDKMTEPGGGGTNMDWYKSLKKPSWTPPNWAFPAIWIPLKVMQTVAMFRIWTMPMVTLSKIWIPTAIFTAHILLGTLWNIVHFGLHKIGASVLCMAVFYVSIIATIVSFFPLDPTASLLMVPTLMWVTVAFALNFTIWRLNCGRSASAPAGEIKQE